MELRLLMSATLCAALAACGGGSGEPGGATASNDAASTTETVAGTSTTNAVEQPADVIASISNDTESSDASAAATAASTQSVAGAGMEAIQAVTVADGNSNVSYNFESAFTKIAPGWTVNWWGNGAVAFNGGRDTRAAFVHGGGASQWYTVLQLPTGGGAHLVYPYGFVKDASYTASVWLRADAATQVEVMIRRDVAPWNVVARRRVAVGTQWQQVSVAGAYPFSEPGSLRVIPIDVGRTISIDDMAITKAVSAAPAPVGGTTLPAISSTAETSTTFNNSAMEESFTRFAPGWYYNAFGGTSTPVFVASRDSRAGYAHGGTASQKFQVVNTYGGEAQLIKPLSFVKGKHYRATAWVRADVATPVAFFMRRDEHPFDSFATRTVTVGTAWQQIVIEGTYIGNTAGSMRFRLQGTSGTIWVDDVKVEEVQRNDMAPFGTGVVADTLFGMHVLKLGTHFVWPTNTHIIRLHNTGTTWRELEPTKGGWDWTTGYGKRLDMYVDYAVKNGGQIVYTMGMTPLWASSTPTVVGMYGAGASGAPKDMNDWRNYVRTLAQRYVGKIRYWELWNEPDFKPHWAGTQAQLVEMARIAAEELHAVDPQNRLVGPGFTAGQGMAALDDLLAAGLGNYVDDIGYHFYYSTNPEAVGAQLDNVRGVMKNRGVGDKPLWITEGAFVCDSLLADCTTALPDLAQQRSVNARAMFMMATRGVANFNFYVYESTDPWRKLVNGTDFTTLTDEGRTLSEARSWLRGTRIVDAFAINDTIHALRLTRGTENSVVLWSSHAGTVVNLPSAWGVTRLRTITGTDSAIPAGGQITIGLEPVLLRP
jgi:hypothetical protein